MATFRKTKSKKSMLGATLPKDWHSSGAEEVAQLELALSRIRQ